MGGDIQWVALPIFVEMFAVVDVDQFIRDLVTIRECMREQS